MTDVCFVCLGNICRSPMAEAVMVWLNDGTFGRVESRATSSWEHGNPIHLGTQAVLRSQGIPFSPDKGSQQISRQDLADFDCIIAMDQQNLADLLALSAGVYDDKIGLLLDLDVPDPYYTGDFNQTYELVLQGCQGLLDEMKRDET